MIARLEDPNQLLKVITEWRIYIGVPKSEDLGENGFYIPNGLGLDASDIDYVIDKVRKIFR